MAVIDNYLEVSIGGELRKLRKPTRRTWDSLYDNAHNWHKQRYADNLRLAGIDGEDMIQELSQFDKRKITTPELLQYVNSGIGLTDALERALVDYGKEAPELADQVEDPMKVACELYGWTVEEPDSTEKKQQTSGQQP